MIPVFTKCSVNAGIDEALPFQEQLYQLNEHSNEFPLLGENEKKIKIFS